MITHYYMKFSYSFNNVFIFFNMSAASKSNSQTIFVDASSKIDINITSPSGCDTPIPTSYRLSDETLANLMEASMRLENLPNQPRKRKRSTSPGASSSKRATEQNHYPAEAKPIYLMLKTLYRKKLSFWLLTSKLSSPDWEVTNFLPQWTSALTLITPGI